MCFASENIQFLSSQYLPNSIRSNPKSPSLPLSLNAKVAGTSLYSLCCKLLATMCFHPIDNDKIFVSCFIVSQLQLYAYSLRTFSLSGGKWVSRRINRVFVAGYGNSINGHWQALWHQQFKNSCWVEQVDWTHPHCDAWVARLDALVQSLDGPILFITHSLGGSTVVEWARTNTANVVGAFMVAVPDVHSECFPSTVVGYQTPPLTALPFPGLLLASANDPYCTLDRAKYFADAWHCEMFELGELGHINSDSDLGDWPAGKQCLSQFLTNIGY